MISTGSEQQCRAQIIYLLKASFPNRKNLLAILFWTWQWKNIQCVIICNYVSLPFPSTTNDLFHYKHSNEKCHWQHTTMYYIHIYSHSDIQLWYYSKKGTQSANYTHVQPSMLMQLSFPLTFHFIACSFVMSISIFLWCGARYKGGHSPQYGAYNKVVVESSLKFWKCHVPVGLKEHKAWVNHTLSVR